MNRRLLTGLASDEKILQLHHKKTAYCINNKSSLVITKMPC